MLIPHFLWGKTSVSYRRPLNSQCVCKEMYSQKFLLDCKKKNTYNLKISGLLKIFLTLRDTEFEMYKI